MSAIISELKERFRPKESDRLDLAELESIKKDYGHIRKICHIRFYSSHIEFDDCKYNTIWSPRYIEDERDLYSFLFANKVEYRNMDFEHTQYFYENLAIISKYLLKKGYTLEEDYYHNKMFVKTLGRKK